MINIKHRNQITDILNGHSVGCELGVFEGEFSEILLRSNKFERLYLVDVFGGKASNFGKNYKDASVLETIVRNKFQSNDNVEVAKSESVNFLKMMPSNSFDFIYIDTTHSYDYTIEELQNSYRVIKNGGFICGHDYCEKFSGVIKAVTEFCELHGYQSMITQETDYPSFIIKVVK